MKILTAKYESGTFKENSVVRITYEGQPSNTIVNVPVNNKNTNYKEILEWAAIDGNNIEDAD